MGLLVGGRRLKLCLEWQNLLFIWSLGLLLFLNESSVTMCKRPSVKYVFSLKKVDLFGSIKMPLKSQSLSLYWLPWQAWGANRLYSTWLQSRPGWLYTCSSVVHSLKTLSKTPNHAKLLLENPSLQLIVLVHLCCYEGIPEAWYFMRKRDLFGSQFCRLYKHGVSICLASGKAPGIFNHKGRQRGYSAHHMMRESKREVGRCHTLLNNQIFYELKARTHVLPWRGHQAIHNGSTPITQTSPTRPHILAYIWYWKVLF